MASVAFMGPRQSFVRGGVLGQQNTPPPTTPLQNQYKLYNSAVGQQAEDYNDIMSGFKTQLNSLSKTPKMNFTQYNPESFNYTPSKDYTNAYGQANELATTGGYSPQQINELRERAISPVRAIYANANREVDRNRRLQGGFSPNYNAVKAKMAREMSAQIGDQITNANAGIAQNVAGNRLAALPTLSNMGLADTRAQNDASQRSTEERNTAQRFNIQMPLEYAKFNAGLDDRGLNALQGMTSLYGTTPALSNMFGNQALQRAQFEQNQADQEQRTGLNILGSIMRG